MSLEFQETFKLQTLTWNYGNVTWRRLKGTIIRRVLPEGAPPLLRLDGNWSAIVSTRGPRCRQPPTHDAVPAVAAGLGVETCSFLGGAVWPDPLS